MFPTKSCNNNYCILFPFGNLNFGLMKHSTYAGGRVSGWVGSSRVGSGQTFCRQSRVGSGRVNVSPGRVGSAPRKVTRGQLWDFKIAANCQCLHSIFSSSRNSTELFSILRNGRKIRKFEMAAQKAEILITRHVYMLHFFDGYLMVSKFKNSSAWAILDMCNTSKYRKFKIAAEKLEELINHLCI